MRSRPSALRDFTVDRRVWLLTGVALFIGAGAALCANMSETSIPSTITVGRGKKSHFDKHEQDKHFFRCVGSFGA